MDIPFPRQFGSKSAHALLLQQHLHDQMMSQSEFCDVTLVVDNVEIKAHWCVLVSCPYFQSLYDSGLAERFSGTVELHIGKPGAVRSALEFLYLGNVKISYDNVQELLEVADYFQIMELKRACQDYLYSVNINTDNCVRICLMCSLYDLDLYTRAFDFLRGNLPEVMQKEDILSLTHDSVLSLVTDLSLCYVSQSDFFRFIVRWVQFEEEVRLTYFEELFCALNLLGIPKKYLEEEVEQHKFVSGSEKCKDEVLSVKSKYKAGLIEEDSGMRDVVIVAGGSGDGLYFNNLFHLFPFSESISVCSVYGFVVNEGRWIELAPLPVKMRKPVVTYDPLGYLYVFNTAHSNYDSVFIVYKYNIEEKTWTSFRLQIPDSITNVFIQNIVSCNSRLYAIVSGNMPSAHKTPPVEEWQTVLLEVKEDTESVIKCNLFQGNTTNAQITSLGVNNRHVCVLVWKHGAKGKKSRQYAKFVMYDAVTEKKLDQSKGAFWDSILIPIENELVTCRMGKYTAKKYSFSDKRWKGVKGQIMSQLPEDPTRQDFSYHSDGVNFYVFGGKDASTKKLLDTAFRFNFEKRKWTKLENMPQAVMQSAICHVKMPADHVRCHISCPHCVYHTRKSQAVYDVECSFDEGDDDTDCDYSYDDDEEDFPSDHWEDYFDYYDPYQDPYQDWY
ncbi:kelch-like protein 11 [Mizuhopecten yessoensis]|uniref:kelch-like protein 11 n=1 Tax=Mizuhopecten yessoensis TaxID=6573 RepID=UPI000B45DF89|nr:kelch-like protein 11 [Mizuhopecten yessoensis]